MAASKAAKSTSKTSRSPWIAERRLERRDAVGGIVVVRIGTPEIDHPYTNWRCPFMFEGLGDDATHYGKSTDSMAALQNALIGIRQLLERTGIPLRWEGFDENLTGFPRDVPWEFGLAFYHKIEKMIDTETDAFIRERDEQRAVRRDARKKAPKKNQ
jgi:hypothetical protein